MELVTQAVLGINTFGVDNADKFRVHESALEKGLYYYEFNGRHFYHS